MNFLNVSQFAVYMACDRKTASKYYKTYLEILGKDKRQKLTVQDLATLDQLPESDVKKCIFG